MNLQDAIKHWTKLAQQKEAFALSLSHADAASHAIKEAVTEAREAYKVAESLQAEQRTGVPHCSCTNPPHAVNR